VEIKPDIDIDSPISYELTPQVPRVIAIDCDGFLTNETCWTEEEMREATPRTAAIKKVNELFKANFIIIHTARRNEFYQVTIDWLTKNGVRFHAIRMEKMPADLYYDDRCQNLEDL
jgi:arabinogalactan endo-1,4-beta-galactosidase